jgi:hypothetical protein
MLRSVAVALIAAAGAAQAGPKISVPSDPRAAYELVSRSTLPNGRLSVVTKRSGPSGVSYSRREIDCRAMTFRYTGDGDSLAALDRPYAKGTMGPLTPQSISTYVAQAACR